MSPVPFPLLAYLSCLSVANFVEGFGLMSSGNRANKPFQRFSPILKYLPDDDSDVSSVVATAELSKLSNFSALLHQPAKPHSSLVQLDFEADIENFIDISRPYYALENEHKITDDETGEVIGFICTGRREMPTSRDSGGLACGEVGRHMAAAGTVAASLMNQSTKRFHYLASNYRVDVSPYKGKAKAEIPNINDKFGTEDPIIFCRCNEISKRTASCEIYLETNDVTWHMTINFSIVSDTLFKKMYPPTLETKTFISTDEVTLNPYSSMKAKLTNKKIYSDLCRDWVTVEASLPPSTSFECKGHFQGNPALPHSAMIFHNCGLLGDAISELTGVKIPFKGAGFRRDQSQDSGIQMLHWECLPENMHFAETYGLQFQCKVYLSKGEMGANGSIYVVECVVKEDVTNKISYKASGRFILNPGKFLKETFHDTFVMPINGSVRELVKLWSILDVNGDGVVSRDELEDFINSKGMVNLGGIGTDLLFDYIDADGNGEISFDELKSFSLSKKKAEPFVMV